MWLSELALRCARACQSLQHKMKQLEEPRSFLSLAMRRKVLRLPEWICISTLHAGAWTHEVV